MFGIDIHTVVNFMKRHRGMWEHKTVFDRKKMRYTTKVYIAGELFTEEVLDVQPLADAIMEMMSAKKAS